MRFRYPCIHELNQSRGASQSSLNSARRIVFGATGSVVSCVVISSQSGGGELESAKWFPVLLAHSDRCQPRLRSRWTIAHEQCGLTVLQ
jgi:hypothetical protein